MSYLKEFLIQINNRDFQKFLVLWEEYCTSDTVEAEELSQILKAIKPSDLAKQFGQIVETALPIWRLITDEKDSYEILGQLINLETTNSQLLYDLVLETLKKRYENDPKFDQKLRLINFRGKENLQGAISRYDLLNHMNKGNIVFHTAGWGTGEIIDVSNVREHLIIEFENIGGRKDLSFANAFKTLTPLPSEHFLARRFSDPDLLEKEGRENQLSLIKLLLHDLGPKSASEIKDELCELVIPEQEWTKWWQGARSKIKKDPMIESPGTLKEPFYLRKAELSPETRLLSAIQNKTGINDLIQATYNFVRDTPGSLKIPEIKQSLQDKLSQLLERPEITPNQSLQIYLLFEQYFGLQLKDNPLNKQIQKNTNIEEIIQSIDIVAFKKRLLVLVKENKQDWPQIFLNLLFKIPQVQLRDYLLKELNKGENKKLVEQKLKELMENPSLSPETFLWYFQKLVNDADEDVPFQNKEGHGLFFESFLTLLRFLESQPTYKDLVKKMHGMLSGQRFALVREMLQGTSLEYTKEILLLASKCHSLSDHDIKILRSLAEVVHTSLAPPKQRKGTSSDDQEIVWTTEEGYFKIQERIRQIGTTEMIENAREIEAARALGDLRENSEFKFAQERRARLQSEMKTLSQQLNRARIITKEDVHANEVGVGCTVDVQDESGKNTKFSILGPWDADPDQHILSFNSKFALAMMGKKKGESFQFKDENFNIIDFKGLY
ncbi:MAG: GreA/GreB family elongation factor [Parachlamydiaceae bacterium]|nr:GreA/GreB family elongation factor [Parachlamydiaceae bacterium]